MKIKIVTVTFALFVIFSCSLMPKQKLNALVIQNKASSPVLDVTLRVPEIGGIVSCSTILPETECSIGFRERANENRAATLSWMQNGKLYTKPLTASTEPKTHPDYLHKAVVRIMDQGQLDVYLD